MGCDIHIMVEYKTVVHEKTKWVNGDYYKLNYYYDPNDSDWGKQYDIVPIFDSRDYTLFSILAGVRNYGDNTPIDEPRGIPNDVTDVVKKEFDSWGGDAHTPSWFTLRELIDYQNNAPVARYKGLVSQEGSLQIDRGEMPDMWCQWASDSIGYTRREWTHELDNLVPLIDALKARAKDLLWLWHSNESELLEKADKVRIVFWFDN